MKFKRWDANSYEIEAGGKLFLVNASFHWQTDAVDYMFDPRSGQGRDTLGEVPASVADIEIFGPDDDAEAVPVSLYPELCEKVLREFAASEQGVRGERAGAWM